MKIYRVASAVVWLVVLVSMMSCNVYSPFEGSGSDLDHIEIGRKYLAEGKFDDAIKEYDAMSETPTKHEKLCTANISKAGMTLSILVSTLTSANVGVLGNVANKLVPWTQARQDAADRAKTECVAFMNASVTSQMRDFSVLLATLSNLLHCSTLMAKTDVVVTNDGTTCTTAGQNRGLLLSSSISVASNGAVDATHPGMCSADVTACRADITSIDFGALGNSQFKDLQNVYSGLPADLKDSAAVPTAIRAALRQTL